MVITTKPGDRIRLLYGHPPYIPSDVGRLGVVTTVVDLEPTGLKAIQIGVLWDGGVTGTLVIPFDKVEPEDTVHEES